MSARLRLPRRAGFTLIETLIASVIMIVVLGATLAANRTIQASASQAADAIEMGSLAQEPIDNLTLMRNILPADVSLGSQLTGSMSMASSDNQTSVGLFKAKPDEYCQYIDDCKSDGSGSAYLSWCDSGDSVCMGDVAAVGGDVGSGQSVETLGTVFGTQSYKINGAGAELVGVRRTPPANLKPAGERRQSIDQTTPIPQNSVYNRIKAANDSSQWSFYKRSVTITRLGYGGDQLYTSGSRETLFDLKSSVYVISVTVQGLHSDLSPVVRTATVTDLK